MWEQIRRRGLHVSMPAWQQTGCVSFVSFLFFDASQDGVCHPKYDEAGGGVMGMEEGGGAVYKEAICSEARWIRIGRSRRRR